MKNQIILEYLEQLDLSDIEAKLYLTLLETGPISVRELAAKIDIKRTTAYLPIEQLIDKGLIIKVVKGANKLVAANDPKDSLEHLVHKKLQAAQSLEQKFPNMIDQITTALPQIKDVGDAEIKFYKGKNGVMKVYEEALKAKELRSYFNIELIKEALPDNETLFAQALKTNQDIRIFELLQDTPESRRRVAASSVTSLSHARYFYKFLPQGVNLSAADILIYDGYVGIINVNNQFTGIVLKNTDFYSNLKELFDLNWNAILETN